jgi:hypothetical protein
LKGSDSVAKKKSSNPTKLPYGPEKIGDVEDRLAKLQEKLREMRQKLKEGPLDQVEWKLGTFLWHITELESLIGTHRGEFDSQFAVASAKATREKVKAQMAADARKR